MDQMQQETIEDLKNRKIWLCYDYAKTGHYAEQIMMAYGAENDAYVKYPKDFAAHGETYEIAAASVIKSSYEGAAFVVPEGYAVVQMTEYREGHFSNMLLARFSNTFREYGGEGRPLNMICRCDTDKLADYIGQDTIKAMGRDRYLYLAKEKTNIFIGAFSDCLVPFFDRPFFDSTKISDCTESIIATIKDYTETEYREKPAVVEEENAVSEFNGIPDFIRVNEKTGKATVLTPRLAEYVRKHEKYLIVRNPGDNTNTKFLYRGGVYRLVPDDEFLGAIRKFIEMYDPDIVESRDLSEVMKQLQMDDTTVGTEDLDANENIINFRNGLLNLRTLEMYPHTPALYSTIQIPCDWQGIQTPTPVFDKYLNDFTENKPERKTLLLQFMGACFSNVRGSRMKQALFVEGEGNVGKSRLLELMQKILGLENYASVSLQSLEERFGTFDLYCKRLGGDPDMSYATIKELKKFKSLTGGDPVRMEQKQHTSFTSIYRGLLWFCMNKLPQFGGDTGEWVYERILPLECGRAVPEKERDPMLTEKMFKEREGIIFRSVMEFRKIIVDGSYRFTMYPEMKRKLADYKYNNNPFIEFMDVCAAKRVNSVIDDNCTTHRMYLVYKAYCEDIGRMPKSESGFRDEMTAYCKVKKHEELVTKKSDNNYYTDYTLKGNIKEEYKQAYGFEAFSRDFGTNISVSEWI